MPYDIGEHSHRFACWAASRAASVKGQRFKTKLGKALLEACGFEGGYGLENLPAKDDFDAAHDRWREQIIELGGSAGIEIRHGVAAKLLNVYLKARFVNECHSGSQKVAGLHPPIDRLLISSLRKHFPNWRIVSPKWSGFNNRDYKAAIDLVRQTMNGNPLWQIEEYWSGFQK